MDLSSRRPDPSTNHNIACKAYHEGTSTWFFEGSCLKNGCQSVPFSGSMENVSSSVFSFAARLLTVSYLHSGLWEEHPLVCHFPVYRRVRELILTQVPQSYNTLYTVRSRTGLTWHISTLTFETKKKQNARNLLTSLLISAFYFLGPLL